MDGAAGPVRPVVDRGAYLPDDVLAHAAIRRGVAPIKVATGEHTANRVMFKQMLQAGAIDVLQLDAARVAGVNENLAILLLAASTRHRCVHTQVGWDCARWSSTCLCSTTWR